MASRPRAWSPRATASTSRWCRTTPRPTAHNMKLSGSRADAVKAYLVAHGIAPTRLVSKGYGFHQPLVPNDTAANRPQHEALGLARRRREGEPRRPWHRAHAPGLQGLRLPPAAGAERHRGQPPTT